MLFHRLEQRRESAGDMRSNRLALHRRCKQRRYALVHRDGEMVRPKPHQPFAKALRSGHGHALPQHQFPLEGTSQSLTPARTRALAFLLPGPHLLALLLRSEIHAQIARAVGQPLECGNIGGRAQLSQQPAARVCARRLPFACACAQPKSVDRRGNPFRRHRYAPSGTRPTTHGTGNRLTGETAVLVWRQPVPATVIRPTRIEPVRTCERGSTSLPTASIAANMSFRLPAMVMPSTG